MTDLGLGNEIRAGFAEMGDALKEAGRKRNAEMVKKQGYVAFKKPEAVSAFHADPEYINWTCQFVDGEYRFYPPRDKKSEILSESNIKKNENASELNTTNKATDMVEIGKVLEIYKREIADLTKTTFISIVMVDGDPSKCRYRLLSTDKKTGESHLVQEFITEFNGRFAMEIIPSLYNQLMGGLPVIDSEKGLVNQRTIAFQNIEGSHTMAFANLSEEQLELIRNMQNFVDSRYFSKPEEHRGMHK